MYSKDKSDNDKPLEYGDTTKVTVKQRGNSYYVYFGSQTKESDTRKAISFKKNQLEAMRIAKSIAYDLDTGNLSLNDLKPLSNQEIVNLYQTEKDKTKLTLIQSIKDNSDNRNVKDIWENYKVIAVNHTAISTQKHDWIKVDSFLSKLTNTELLLCNVNDLHKALLNHYAYSTVKNCLSYVQSALNVIINNKPISSKGKLINDYKLTSNLVNSSKSNKIKRNNTKKHYSEGEIKAILDNFKNFEQKEKDTTNKGSRYYYPFILFLAMTGMRPSEVVDLLVSDIKISQGKVQVSITKANGNNHTKTYTDRLIPVNSSLASFLVGYVNDKDKNSLLFPSVKGNKIDYKNFSDRHYKPIVNKLIEKGVVKEYLTLYHLRHSFATNQLQKGMAINVLSAYLGHSSIQTTIEYYIGSDYENTDIPDIY